MKRRPPSALPPFSSTANGCMSARRKRLPRPGSASMSGGTDRAGDAEQAGRVFTIPPGAPFFDCLAHAILRGDLPRMGGAAPGPLDLADFRVYLPNRAACRALQAA